MPSETPLATGVRRHGFRKWYERELLSGHAHMVLAFLSVIALVASLEAFRGAETHGRLADVAFVLICAAIGLWALRRYLYLLMRAEEAASQASCPDCGEYGRFALVGDNRATGETAVCCRKCSRHWTIAIDP